MTIDKSGNPVLDDGAPVRLGPQPEEHRERRGHAFYPQVDLPRLRSDTKTAAPDKVIGAHYFVGSCDWWLTEYDPKTGEAFGYVDLGYGGEWGYMWLPEMEEVLAHGWLVVERDCWWEPKTFQAVMEARHGR